AGGGARAPLQEGVRGSEVPEPTTQTGTAARAVDVGVAQVVAIPVLDEVVLEPRPEAPRDRAEDVVARGDRDHLDQGQPMEIHLAVVRVVAYGRIEEGDLGVRDVAAQRIEHGVEGRGPPARGESLPRR